jgi:hypothetical protein
MLLENEADALTKAQMDNLTDLHSLLKAVIRIADKTHKEVAKVLNPDQQFLMPTIIENRKNNLKEKVAVLVDSLWYELEHPQS